MRGGPTGRAAAGPTHPIRRLEAGTLLAALLVIGLAIRILVAAVLLPRSGFAIDVGDFTAWGQRLAAMGPGAFYEAGYFSDYPPGYLYVLWFLGLIGGALAPLVGQDATGALVKLPGILADLGVAALLFVIGRRWAGQLLDRTIARRWGFDGVSLGLVAASVYLLNPGTIFNSAVWGQIDSVGTLVLLGTLYALGRGWIEAASVGAVLAFLVKFQFGLLIPLVAVVGLKRYLVGRSSDPAHDGRSEPVRVVSSLVAALLAMTVLIFPFGMRLYTPPAAGTTGASCLGLPAADPVTSLVGKFCEAANTYTGLTINAFNLWRNPWSGLGDSLHWGDDTLGGLSLAGIGLTWQQVGTLLFLAVAVVALWQVARRDDMRGLLVGSLVLAIAFFALPTRVHERYLFPALALSAALVLAGRVWPWIATGLSVSFFANVYWVYSEDWSFAGGVMNPGLDGAPMPQDPLLAATLFTDGGIWLLSALSVVLLAVVAWLAVRLALQPISRVEAATEPEPMRAPARAPRAPRATRRLTPAEPAVEGRPPGWLGWLSPNPADAYLHEPTRRLDRRDALILLALVVFALLFRLWRLEVPRGHHFDEVYHARSAAEFLSSWQNDWDRDVYEWTHPMLAKYLIAGGILVADPNRPIAARELEQPSSALTVLPERRFSGVTRSIGFTLVDAETISAWDAQSGEELASWQTGGPAGTLAVDADTLTLLVGRSDEGMIERYDIEPLAGSRADRAPPAEEPLAVPLAGVSQMLVGDGSDPMLVRGPDGIVVVDAVTDEVAGVASGRFGGMALVHSTEDQVPDWVAATDVARRVVAFFDATTLAPRTDGEEVVEVETDVALAGPLLRVGDGDDQRLFALTGELPADDGHGATRGGIAAIDADGSDGQCSDRPCVIDVVPLPGAGTLIGWQAEAGVVYIAGVAPEGPQVWTIEPHLERRDGSSVGLAVFDATSLPGTPVAMAFDVAASSPEDDHATLLLSTVALDGTARVVQVDAGSNAFAWRLAGVAFGSALVGLVYLLVATMFSRRRIAVLAAAFVAIDGMSYVMSRISMNDIFVATFIVAAYALFWQIWSGRWSRSAWWALPLVGVLIGLAAASKWVGFYALAGLLVLVLARSHLGRLLLVGLVALAVVFGGIGGPWPFLLVTLGLLALALAIAYAKPIRLSLGDTLVPLLATTLVLAGVSAAFLLAFDSVADARTPNGAVELLFGVLARGAQAGWPVWVMLGAAGLLIAWRAALSFDQPETDARWYRPGEMAGFAWPWVGACLVVVPLVVYGLSYVPYLLLGHPWAGPEAGPGYGWPVDELHAQMFGYHFNLQAGHDSASPWWSWPLALKPTWFYDSGPIDGNRLAVIYNGGNPILFWAGLPAIVIGAVLAWRRRSAALVLVVMAFAFQFVPWIRIERATFAYHYLTAVVFAMIAVAYLVDELLRRPLWRPLAIGYLALVVVVGVLVFPLGSALPVPDAYINAARALPPWNFGFQFPDPPQGDRAELLSVGALRLLAGALLALVAMAWAIYGRWLVDRWRRLRGSRALAAAQG